MLDVSAMTLKFVMRPCYGKPTTRIKAQGSIFEPFTGIFNALRLP
jgi:hypothetical protein